MEWFIALRYLRGKRRLGFISLIAYVSAAGVFLGSLVLVVALSVASGFEKEVRDRIVGMFAHARISQYYGRPLVNADSLRQIILSCPDVLAASPYLSGKGTIQCAGSEEGVLIMGVDDTLEPRVTDLGKCIIMGKLKLDSVESERGYRGPGIVIGSGLADRLGIRPGAEAIVGSVAEAQAGDLDLDPMSRIRAGRYVVSGIFETGMYEYDLNLVYISINSAQLLFGRGIEGIQIKTPNLFYADKTAERVRAKLGGYPYRAMDWKNQNKSLFKWMQLERLVIFLVISLIIIVAAFNIVCSLMMMIMEKRREIGILMGMGATTGSVMRIFMFTGVAIGLAGSSLGVALGGLLCWVQSRWSLIPLPGDIYFIDKLPMLFRPLDMGMVFLASNLVCFAATLYPAWEASRIPPAESLRID